MRFSTSFALAAASLLASSCRDNGIDDSADVSTRDIQIVVEVNGRADGTVVRAYASALVPYSGALTLTGGDQLHLHGEGPLEREAGTSWYARTSPRNAGRFSVDLLRPSDRPLTDVGLEVPAPFTLTTTATRVKWSDDIELTWDRADGDHVMSLLVESVCSKRLLRYLQTDTGSYTLNGGEIERLDPAKTCPVTITIVRAAPLVSSRGMFGRAAQERTVQVELQP